MLNLKEDQIIALSLFGTYYTNLTHHSRFTNITVNELQRLSPKSRIMGEFIAVAGFSEIDFTVFKDVISSIDDYLETGIYQEDIMIETSEKIKPHFEALSEIARSYIEGKQGDEAGYGVPVLFFVPTYALNLLAICKMVETNFTKDEKSRILDYLNTIKRNDPDPEPMFA